MISGLFAEALDEFELARSRFEECLRVADIIDDDECRGFGFFGLGDVLANLGQFDRAEPLFRVAMTLFRDSKKPMWLAVSLSVLGLVVHERGDDDSAQALLNEALELSRTNGFIWGTAASLNRLGRIASARADFALAIDLYAESLAIWRELGDRWRMTRVLVDLSVVACATHQFECAVRLLGGSEALNEPLDVSCSFADDSPRAHVISQSREQLDSETFATLWAAGRAMSWEEAIAEAMSLSPSAGRSDRPAIETIQPRLTGREQEVLQLLVAGRSDRQIAEALFISRRTAQGHVAGIFNKLGVNSRTAAATTALRLGLVPSETFALS